MHLSRVAQTSNGFISLLRPTGITLSTDQASEVDGESLLSLVSNESTVWRSWIDLEYAGGYQFST